MRWKRRALRQVPILGIDEAKFSEAADFDMLYLHLDPELSLQASGITSTSQKMAASSKMRKAMSFRTKTPFDRSGRGLYFDRQRRIHQRERSKRRNRRAEGKCFSSEGRDFVYYRGVTVWKTPKRDTDQSPRPVRLVCEATSHAQAACCSSSASRLITDVANFVSVWSVASSSSRVACSSLAASGMPSSSAHVRKVPYREIS